MATKKLGEILVEGGLITEEQLQITLEESKKQKGHKLGDLLVKKGFASELDIAQTLGYQLGIPFVDLQKTVITPEAVQLVPEKMARQYVLMPISMESLEGKKMLKVAMSDPLNLGALDDIRFSTNYVCSPMVASPVDILQAIQTHYHISVPIGEIIGDIVKESFLEVIHERDHTKDSDELMKKSEAPPIIKMVNSIIIHGIESRASDIHVEPQEHVLNLRERVDGLLRDVMQLPKWVQGAVTSRIKIMARMDISERRVPQDGRFQVSVAGRRLDLRISTLPSHYGEKIVMRILDSESTLLSLDEIGLSPSAKERIQSAIERPQGIVLVTGPTGSGKTSSLYAMINHIRTQEINIVTLENPIEYKLEGVTQVLINEKVGLTFPYCLRAVLRQDPDVIFVGEMRDAETAEIAHQASLTGHLVFSTLHTTDAASSISRLKNMGIPLYLIASSLNGIIAQRLMRKICLSCKEPYTPEEKELENSGFKKKAGEKLVLYRGKGCHECGDTGYQGRIGVFEALIVSDEIKDRIASDETENAIRKAALNEGMVAMYEDGMEKIRQGVTTLGELRRVVHSRGQKKAGGL